MISFTVEGDPVPKGRPRHGNGRTFTPKRTTDAEKRIAEVAVGLDVTPYDQPVRVSLQFWCATRRRTDLDNLMKLVCDALNKIAYTDDHHIHVLRGRLHRAALGEQPRTEVRIEPLGAGAPPAANGSRLSTS